MVHESTSAFTIWNWEFDRLLTIQIDSKTHGTNRKAFHNSLQELYESGQEHQTGLLMSLQARCDAAFKAAHSKSLGDFRLFN